LSNVVAIAAGGGNSLVLKADGKVMGWGLAGACPDPASLSNIVAIAAGDNGPALGYISWMALQADGRVVAGSQHGYSLGPYLSDVVAIAASRGTDHHISLALMRNGSVAALPWGFNFYASQGQPLVPAGLANVVAVAAGNDHNLALIGSGPPYLLNRLVSRTAVMSGNSYFRIEAGGAPPLYYQWEFNGTNLAGATDALLALTDLQPNQVGTYSVTVSNPFGTVSNSAQLTFLAPLDITAQPQSRTNFGGSTATFSVTVTGIEPLYFQVANEQR